MSKKLNIRKIAQLTGHNASIFALTDGKDEGYFRSAAGDGWVAEWALDNAEHGKLIAKVDAQVFSILNIKNENRIVAGNMNGGAHWINLANTALTQNVQHHQKGIFGMIQIDDFLYSVGGHGILTKWQILTSRTVESVHLSNKSLRCLDYSEKRKEIAIGSSDHSIYFLDSTTLELKRRIKNAHENSVFSIRYHPDNQHLLSGGRDAHLNIWDLKNDCQKVSTQPAHWFTINDIIFHPNGHLFATASRDKTIKIWDATTFKLLKVLDTIRHGCHVNSINCLYWSKYKNWLISGSDDRSIILWEIEMS